MTQYVLYAATKLIRLAPKHGFSVILLDNLGFDEGLLVDFSANYFNGSARVTVEIYNDGRIVYIKTLGSSPSFTKEISIPELDNVDIFILEAS